MRRQFVIFLEILCCFIVLPAAAQTAGAMDEILSSRELRFQEMCAFVLVSAGDLVEGTTPEEAFEDAMAHGWISQAAAADSPVTMGDLSLLVMEAFNMKGGLFYNAFRSRRHAFRSMVRRGFIQGASDPGMTLTGDEFLAILNNVMEYHEQLAVARGE
jgi:hypothetical protein